MLKWQLFHASASSTDAIAIINANFKTETDKIRAVFIGRHQISAMMYQECLT
jgi:hypothetical protein